MRSIAFAMFTPFYFIKAGLYVSLPLLWGSLGIIMLLFIIRSYEGNRRMAVGTCF
jgi:Kef-type K+ transport system membrane component KefB